MLWFFFLSIVLLVAGENKNAEEAKQLLDEYLVSSRDLLPEDVKPEIEDLRLPAIFTPEIENNVSDPEARKFYIEALRSIKLEKIKGEKKTDEIIGYLTKATELGHKTSSKLLAYFKLFDGKFDEIGNIRHTFESLALSGSPDAQFGLGFLYSTGLGGTEQNTAKAITYYNFAAIGGSPMAAMAMGYRHLYGIGVAKECRRAVELYYDAASAVMEKSPYFYMFPPTDQKLQLTDAIDPDVTENRLAHLIPSVDDEMSYLEFQVAQGNPPLAAHVGKLYLTGQKGIRKNYERAVKYLKEAAQAGEVAAMSQLGAMYLEGTPVTPASNSTAFKYFYNAAIKGDAAAISGLGYMYLFGYGVTSDPKLADILLTYAISKGNTLANVWLGLLKELYQKNREGYAKAAKLYEQAAKKGETLAIYYLARLHYYGRGVPQSCPIATQLFRLVAERGEVNRRMMEAFQTYTKKDYNKAAATYLFLAEMGLTTAQMNFAHIVDQGQVGIKEPKALTYWKRAAGQGSSYATVKLGDYYYYGKGVEKNSTQAYIQYEKAAHTYKSAQAMFNLGIMHEMGDGAAQDVHLARRYYHLATELNPTAYYPTFLAEMKMDLVEWVRNKVALNEIFVLGQRLDGYFKNWDLICCGIIGFLVGHLFFYITRQ